MKRLALHQIDAAGSTTLPDAASAPGGLFVLTGGSVELGFDGLHPTDAGMTYLADRYVATLAAAGKTPSPGSPITAYGDSWTAQDIANTPGQRAIIQLQSRLSLGTLTNQAVGGYLTGDAAVRAIGTGGTFTAGTSGLVFVGIGLNDLGLTDTPALRTSITNNLRALFAALTAAERIEQTAFTFDANWSATSNTDSRFSGGSNAVTSTDGATATYEITTPGDYYLLTHGTDGSSLVGGQLTIEQDGVVLAVVDENGQHVNNGNQLASGHGPLPVRLADLAAGTLEITFSKLGRASAYGFLDALIRVSPTPPTILAAKPVSVTYPDYQKPGLLAHVRDQYDVMADEFGPTVVVCDPTADVATLWYSDGSTWQQIGAGSQGLDAEAVRDAIAAALVAGPNVTLDVDDPGDSITIGASAGGAAGTSLVPLTTTVGGVPQLVWDLNDELVLTEVTL